MQAHFSTVEIVIDQNGTDTRAVARLRADADSGRIGTGIATIVSGDMATSDTAANLATARALSDLAEQLFDSAASNSALPTSWL
ncbi:dsRBD fold-containing protein [Antrihabitans sp. YC2-6]|uniref:dsRBD fold-containing protein n=1 Tax=Antrihabitans sp. YC2-6 TaxID=2799498 RepID=UPI0018F5D189|nr:dsRBD fold-containing protein [Antrihabitans sp. YC2-6]MBJ8347027.1 DUF1876 family protein [Antrihabitans sp. YC2-6]